MRLPDWSAEDERTALIAHARELEVMARAVDRRRRVVKRLSVQQPLWLAELGYGPAEVARAMAGYRREALDLMVLACRARRRARRLPIDLAIAA
jgi:acetoacetate decarboxylase